MTNTNAKQITAKRGSRKLNMRAVAATAIFSAIGTILMILEFSVPFVPSFLKFDFSDLPALIVSFAYGPLWGVAVCLVKNLLHLPFTSSTGVGELSNFILGAVFVLTAGVIYHFFKSKKGAVIGSLAGAVVMALVQFVTNYYLVYPFYANFMPMDAIIGAYQVIIPWVDNLWKALFAINFPFTFIKGLLDSVICILVYKKLSPIMKYAKKDRIRK